MGGYPMGFFRKRFFSPLVLSMSAISVAMLFACTGDSKAKDKPRYTFKEGQGPNGAVASVDGKPVTEEELMGDEKLEFIDAQRRVYDLRMNRVGRVLIEKVYGEEAKKAGMSVEEYVEKNVLKGEPKIADKDYEKFVKEKKIPKEQLNAQLKERIMAYMKAQKRQDELTELTTKLSKQHKVEIYFSKPAMKMNVDVGQAPTFGGKDAKVKIVEFSDFQCPFCTRAAATVNEIKKIYGNKIQVAFKHYPLPMHPNARPASEAAMCVNELGGSDKFWKYHDKLFENAEKLDPESIKKMATAVGVKADDFNKCFEEKRFAKVVQDDIEYGNRLGVRSTPTFFINGRVLSGAQPVEAFREVIDEELSGS
jgi:protein-disulfide isomerase